MYNKHSHFNYVCAGISLTFQNTYNENPQQFCFSDIFYNKGNIFYKMENWEEAIKFYDIAIEFNSKESK